MGIMSDFDILRIYHIETGILAFNIHSVDYLFELHKPYN